MPSLEHRIARWMKKYSISRDEALLRINKLDEQYRRSAANKERSRLQGQTYVFKGNQEIQTKLDQVTFTYVTTINNNNDMAIGNGKFKKTVLKHAPVKTEWMLDPITKRWIQLDE